MDIQENKVNGIGIKTDKAIHGIAEGAFKLEKWHFSDVINQQLNCQYCGTNVQIDNTTAPLQEFDLQPQLSIVEDSAAATRQMTYKCTRCGSASTFDAEK